MIAASRRKWEYVALNEMTDSKLKDFLTTARRIPNNDLYAFRAGADQAPGRVMPTAQEVRGKSKASPAELLGLLEKARSRQQQPRQAEHRSVKVAELIEVIEGFGRSAGIPSATLERWQQELCGFTSKDGKEKFGLLNKSSSPGALRESPQNGLRVVRQANSAQERGPPCCLLRSGL